VGLDPSLTKWALEKGHMSVMSGAKRGMVQTSESAGSCADIEGCSVDFSGDCVCVVMTKRGVLRRNAGRRGREVVDAGMTVVWK